jgi:uncharacterized protein
MSQALPEHIHPIRLARRGESLSGNLPPARMPRLTEMLLEGDNRAQFTLRFGLDDAGQARVHGRVEAMLCVLCQRCLEPMSIQVERDVHLALVHEDDEARALDAAYDPLLVDDQPVSLSALVEDEIILAMPDFARHAPGACSPPPGADDVADEPKGRADQAGDSAGESGRDNPFLVLETIKQRKTP